MGTKLTFRIAIVAGLIVLAVIAPVAVAGKGGNGKGHSNASDTASAISWAMVADRNGDGQPNWNDTVTFNVRTDATDRPWVLLNCYQGGAWVSTTSHGLFASYPYPNFTLASTAWTGGAGECVATLYEVTANGNQRDLASLRFAVAA